MKSMQLAALAAALASSSLAAQTTPAPTAAQIERGRYMVVTGQCNNCHTAGYSASQGNIAESRWLLGDPRPRREPHGTVYGTNLRHYVSVLSLEQWLVVARNARPRAPMPWWNLRATSDEDLTAMYHYMRSLQPIGEPMPAFEPAPR
jgi:mono/diheme cytochrome c family protein